RAYGISRQTGHKWLRRFRAQGYNGLVEQGRRPQTSPLATAEEVIVRILELRDQHWSWGPDKIARILRRAHGENAPSKSTVARVLHRLGRMRKRRPPVRIWSVDGRPRVEIHAPTSSGLSTSRRLVAITRESSNLGASRSMNASSLSRGSGRG